MKLNAENVSGNTFYFVKTSKGGAKAKYRGKGIMYNDLFHPACLVIFLLTKIYIYLFVHNLTLELKTEHFLCYFIRLW